MPAFRSIRLWYLVVFLFALHASGCTTSGGERPGTFATGYIPGVEVPATCRKILGSCCIAFRFAVMTHETLLPVKTTEMQADKRDAVR